MTIRRSYGGDLSLEFKPRQDPNEVQALAEGFHSALSAQLGSDRRDLFSLVLRGGDGSVVGGLLGKILFRDLHVDIVWLHETVRGRGYGRDLLLEAEAYGRQEGCEKVVLNTMRKGVVRHCQRLGYQIMARIDDFAMGQPVFFLRKDLRERPGS